MLSFNSIKDLLNLARFEEEMANEIAFNSIKDLQEVRDLLIYGRANVFQFYKRSSYICFETRGS